VPPGGRVATASGDLRADGRAGVVHGARRAARGVLGGLPRGLRCPARGPGDLVGGALAPCGGALDARRGGLLLRLPREREVVARALEAPLHARAALVV